MRSTNVQFGVLVALCVATLIAAWIVNTDFTVEYFPIPTKEK